MALVWRVSGEMNQLNTVFAPLGHCLLLYDRRRYQGAAAATAGRGAAREASAQVCNRFPASSLSWAS
jgi:hypothetical protein